MGASGFFCGWLPLPVWNLGVLYGFCTKIFFVPVFPDFFPACRPAGCSPHVFNFSARTARDFSIGPRYGISGRQSQSSRWSHGVNWPLQRRLHRWPRGYPLKMLGDSVVVAPDSTCVRIGQLPPHPMMRWPSLHGKYIALKKIHDFFFGVPPAPAAVSDSSSSRPDLHVCGSYLCVCVCVCACLCLCV